MAAVLIDVKEYVRPLLLALLPNCTDTERESVVELIEKIADNVVQGTTTSSPVPSIFQPYTVYTNNVDERPRTTEHKPYESSSYCDFSKFDCNKTSTSFDNLMHTKLDNIKNGDNKKKES